MRSARGWSSLGSLAWAFALLAFSTTAAAQSDEQRANARALATQGAQAFFDERWQDAVDLFDRAESLVHAPTHLLFSARAHVKLGHYVKARELYLRITQQKLGPDAPDAFRDARASAERELVDVEPHVAQLTISVKGGDPKLARVTMDETAVPSVLLGVWRPVDPGEHEIRAEAEGFRTQTIRVRVGDGGKASAVLELVPDGTAKEASEPAAAPRSRPPRAPRLHRARRTSLGATRERAPPRAG
jgi:hypothetical protein